MGDAGVLAHCRQEPDLRRPQDARQEAQLPPGWKYRVKLLDQDLGIGAIDGIAHVTQDDLENTYNACFEQGGQKNCTYKP